MGSTGCIAYFTMQQLLEHWNPLLETHLKHQFGVDILQEWDSILQDTVSAMDQKPLYGTNHAYLIPNGPFEEFVLPVATISSA